MITTILAVVGIFTGWLLVGCAPLFYQQNVNSLLPPVYEPVQHSATSTPSEGSLFYFSITSSMIP